MFIILSESFSGGGAERVLALLANDWGEFDGPLRLITLSTSNSYLQQDRVPEIFNRNIVTSKRLNRVLNIFEVGRSIAPGATVLVCSYFLLMAIAPFACLQRFKVIFRPSIDYHYIHNEVLHRFGFIVSYFLLNYLNRCLRSSTLIYQTPAIKYSFEKIVGPNTVGYVVPNPTSVDVHSFPAYTQPAKSQLLDILLMGRLVPEKGFDRFLVALKACGDKVRVHLCGEGPQLNLLIDIAAENGVELIHHGFKNLRAFKIDAAVLVVPSRVEGFPNIVLEGALAGWPIIISKEVNNCILGSPVTLFCEVMDFESPVSFDALERIAFGHSTEDSLEQIMEVRKVHSLQGFKSTIKSLIK